MAEDEAPEKPVKKVKKAVEDVAPPAEEVKLPSPHEVREARKAQLVEWCQALGLDSVGKVDELRKRLLERLEQAAPPAKKEKAKKPEKPEEEEKEEEAYEVKRKPKLDDHTRALLKLRAKKSAERPPFRRQEWFRYKKFGHEWRKPQGGQSKLRRHFRYRWNLPSVGYRGPREVRGLHPSGFREVLVHNPRQIEGIDPDRQAVRIAQGVGTRKREMIEKECEERKIRVLNRLVME